MNKAILMGRLTRDPEVRYSQEGEKTLAIARYTLAVERKFKRTGNNNGNSDEQTADFITCVAFGRYAEIAEKYFRQGLKVIVTGRIQTGSYTNKDGQKVYTTNIVVEDQEFAESKTHTDYPNGNQPATQGNGFQPAQQGNNFPPAQQGNNFPPAQQGNSFPPFPPEDGGFMNIPEGLDEELPFN